VFEGNDTQDEAVGAAIRGPDLTGGHVGERTTRHGEDISGEEGKEPGRHGPPQGESQPPVGSSPRGSAGVDPAEPIDGELPRWLNVNFGGRPPLYLGYAESSHEPVGVEVMDHHKTGPRW
jgi:hypothetical protein